MYKTTVQNLYPSRWILQRTWATQERKQKREIQYCCIVMDCNACAIRKRQCYYTLDCTGHVYTYVCTSTRVLVRGLEHFSFPGTGMVLNTILVLELTHDAWRRASVMMSVVEHRTHEEENVLPVQTFCFLADGFSASLTWYFWLCPFLLIFFLSCVGRCLCWTFPHPLAGETDAASPVAQRGGAFDSVLVSS